MALEAFEMVVLLVTVLTGLTVEALKNILDTTKYNLVAGGVSLAISAFVGVVYAILESVTVDIKYIVFYLCIAFISWLSSMVGYDKVRQALEQVLRD